MGFSLEKIKLWVDARNKIRMYCDNKPCDEKALGTVKDVGLIQDVVQKHGRDAHGEPYPFD